MKKHFKILMKKTLLFLLLITGCTQQAMTNDTTVNESEMPMRIISDYTSTINECDSLCNVDADAYCTQERIITVNEIEVTGTCRAFSRQDNVSGFNKCEGFCRTYDKSSTVCTVNGEIDSNCDGIKD